MAKDKDGNIESRLSGAGLGEGDAPLPDWPIIVPYTIGVMQAQGAGGDGLAVSMVVVLNLDDVPGLGEAVDRNGRGEQFDTVTAWGISQPPEFDSPVAMLALELPEIDLGFYVAIVVDEYIKGLRVAAQTKNVMIVDAEQYRHLNSEGPFEAFKHGKSMKFTVEDANPLLRVLLQRLDFPSKGLGSEASEDEGKEAVVSAEEFIDGATPVSVAAIQVTAGDPSIVALVDPRARTLNYRLGSNPYFDGRWSTMATDDGPLARLDCSLEGERVGSWFVRNPPQELVRATASAAHGVLIIDKQILGDREEAMQSYLREGVSIWVDASTQEMFKIMESSPPPEDESRTGQSR